MMNGKKLDCFLLMIAYDMGYSLSAILYGACYEADIEFRFICTHQWRSCEDIAEWVHEDSTGSTVAGWTEWSECFAQREETKVLDNTIKYT